jgi:hypothetical protein
VVIGEGAIVLFVSEFQSSRVQSTEKVRGGNKQFRPKGEKNVEGERNADGVIILSVCCYHNGSATRLGFMRGESDWESL